MRSLASRRLALTLPLLSLLLAAHALSPAALSAQRAAQNDPNQDDSTEDEARGLYLAGAAAFEGGRYREALGHFQRAYELSDRPALLYNIASAAERAREDELALASYEAFLERSPESTHRARVEARIKELRELLYPESTEATEPGATASPPREPREPRKPIDKGKLLSWSLVSAGAATAVSGGVVLGLGFSDKSTVTDPAEGARWDEGAIEARERGERRLTAGAVLLPVGLAAAAVGAVLTLKGGKKSDAVSVHVGPGGVQFRGRF